MALEIEEAIAIPKWGCADRTSERSVWTIASPKLTGDLDYMGGNQFCIFHDPTGPALNSGEIRILEIVPKKVTTLKIIKSYLGLIDPRGITYDGQFFHVLYQKTEFTNGTEISYTYEQIDIKGNTVRSIKGLSFIGNPEGMCHFIDNTGEYFAIVERGQDFGFGDSLRIFDRDFNQVKSFIMGQVPLGTSFGIFHDGMNFIVAHRGAPFIRPGFKIIDPISEKTVDSAPGFGNFNGIAFDGMQVYYNLN